MRTNRHVKFGVLITFVLGVRQGGAFLPSPCKTRWSNTPCKIGLSVLLCVRLLPHFFKHVIDYGSHLFFRVAFFSVALKLFLRVALKSVFQGSIEIMHQAMSSKALKFRMKQLFLKKVQKQTTIGLKDTN